MTTGNNQAFHQSPLKAFIESPLKERGGSEASAAFQWLEVLHTGFQPGFIGVYHRYILHTAYDPTAEAGLYYLDIYDVNHVLMSPSPGAPILDSATYDVFESVGSLRTPNQVPVTNPPATFMGLGVHPPGRIVVRRVSDDSVVADLQPCPQFEGGDDRRAYVLVDNLTMLTSGYSPTWIERTFPLTVTGSTYVKGFPPFPSPGFREIPKRGGTDVYNDDGVFLEVSVNRSEGTDGIWYNPFQVGLSNPSLLPIDSTLHVEIDKGILGTSTLIFSVGSLACFDIEGGQWSQTFAQADGWVDFPGGLYAYWSFDSIGNGSDSQAFSLSFETRGISFIVKIDDDHAQASTWQAYDYTVRLESLLGQTSCPPAMPPP